MTFMILFASYGNVSGDPSMKLLTSIIGGGAIGLSDPAP
jgi:hypothetical protein